MGKIVDHFLHIVDVINTWLGKGVSLTIFIMMLIVSYEVIARYVFSAPTIWAWDINMQILAIVTFLSGGYVLLQNGHVNVDILYSRWSSKQKAVADLVTFPIFFCFLAILVWSLGVMTLDSIAEREVGSTILAPPIYPMKILLTIGSFLLLMQGTTKFIRDLRVVLSKKGK